MKKYLELVSRLVLLCFAAGVLIFSGCKKEIIKGEWPEQNKEEEEEPEVTEVVLNSEYLFDTKAVPFISLEIELKDWNDLLDWYDQNPNNEEYIPAKFTFNKNGRVFAMDSAGVRLRGNTSRRRPEGNTGEKHRASGADWHHAHFAVKFSEYRDSLFCGHDRIILKWHKDDPMYCREIYCYNLFRAYGVWSSPRASYARLEIHVAGDPKPAYYGVYALIESVNDGYLEDRQKEGKFKSVKGNLWKASWGADLSSISEHQMGVESISLNPSESKSYVYDLKTNKKKGLDAAKTQLKAFVEEMRNLEDGSTALRNFLNSRMDLDLFLRAMTVNVAVGMWDDYWHNTNNFYFYFDSDEKFYFIPYDYDNTLGTSNGLNSGTQNPLQWGPTDNSRLLIKKVFSLPECKQAYLLHLRELTEPGKDFFFADSSALRIRNWHKLISNYVSNDTGEDMSIRDLPASWGNCSFYRLLSGNNLGGANGDANFFSTKAASIPK